MLRQDGKLGEAREKLLICAGAACPTRMRDECTVWSAEVQTDMPSVVVSLRTSDGRDVPGARLLIDGRVAAEALDGTATPIDPGKHVLRVEAPDQPASERDVVMALGDRNRRVEFKLAVAAGAAPAAQRPPAPKPVPSVEASRPFPLSVWLLGAVGVVGLGVGSYVGVAALSRRSDLGACKPTCPKDDVNRVKRDYVISEIAIGVGAVALGAAVFIAVGSQKDSPQVGVSLDPSGGRASVRARF